jgi:hypothetical protein
MMSSGQCVITVFDRNARMLVRDPKPQVGGESPAAVVRAALAGGAALS